MKRIMILTVLISVMVIGLIGVQQDATAAVVLSNRTNWSDIAGYCLATGEIQAAQFTTNAETNVLNSVTIQAHDVTTTPLNLSMSLYADNSGSQGAEIALIGSQTVTGGSNDFIELTYTPSSTVILDPSTTYWLGIYHDIVEGCPIGWTHDDFIGGPVGDPSGIFTFIDAYDNGVPTNGAVAIEVDASPYVPNSIDQGQYGKIGQVLVTAPGSALYESAGGNVVRDAAGQEIWVPNVTAYDPTQDTYDVISQVEIDGTVWVEIFLGNSLSTVWLPVGGGVSVLQ